MSRDTSLLKQLSHYPELYPEYNEYKNKLNNIEELYTSLVDRRSHLYKRLYDERFIPIGRGLIRIDYNEGFVLFNDSRFPFTSIKGASINLDTGNRVITTQTNDFSSITKTKNKPSIGKAIVGGVIAGPAGAVIGGVGGKKSKGETKGFNTTNSTSTDIPICNYYSLYINIDNFIEELVLLDYQIDRDSSEFKEIDNEAKLIISKLRELSHTPMPEANDIIPVEENPSLIELDNQINKVHKDIVFLRNNPPNFEELRIQREAEEKEKNRMQKEELELKRQNEGVSSNKEGKLQEEHTDYSGSENNPKKLKGWQILAIAAVAIVLVIGIITSLSSTSDDVYIEVEGATYENGSNIVLYNSKETKEYPVVLYTDNKSNNLLKTASEFSEQDSENNLSYNVKSSCFILKPGTNSFAEEFTCIITVNGEPMRMHTVINVKNKNTAKKSSVSKKKNQSKKINESNKQKTKKKTKNYNKKFSVDQWYEIRSYCESTLRRFISSKSNLYFEGTESRDLDILTEGWKITKVKGNVITVKSKVKLSTKDEKVPFIIKYNMKTYDLKYCKIGKKVIPKKHFYDGPTGYNVM